MLVPRSGVAWAGLVCLWHDEMTQLLAILVTLLHCEQIARHGRPAQSAPHGARWCCPFTNIGGTECSCESQMMRVRVCAR